MWTAEFNKTHARDMIAEHYPNPSALQSDVIGWILDNAPGYDEDATSWDNMASMLADLQYGGCASGMVSHLIYYTDTDKAWAQYGEECARIVQDQADDCGCAIGELINSDYWDVSDPMALESYNRCALVWAAFEHTALEIGWALGIEL